MNESVHCLILDLKQLNSANDLYALRQTIQVHPITLNAVATHVHADSREYHRELLTQTEEFQLLVITWMPGQKSPIHNHRGSLCCIRVLQGTAVETCYSHDREGVVQVHTNRFAEGTVFGSEDADIHTLENASTAKTDLVTLHVYRPALNQMELFDFAQGRLVSRTPANIELGKEQ